MTKNQTMISCAVPHSLLADLQRVAAVKAPQLSRSAIIREAIDDWLKRHSHTVTLSDQGLRSA